jgi:2-hydroxychromene-2-carboxylate isomerase
MVPIISPQVMRAQLIASGVPAELYVVPKLGHLGTAYNRDAVDHAIANGVFGVPYFIADGEPIWGVDRMWMVEHWATRHTWA